MFKSGKDHPMYVDGTCDRRKNRFYRIYSGMIQRCENKNRDSYARYGGRGIEMKWDNYLDFKRDMYPSYTKHVALHGEKNTSIDRIDVNGSYSKENCRWATPKEQARNTRRNFYVDVDGVNVKFVDYADSIGCTTKKSVSRLRMGWDEESIKDGKHYLRTGIMRGNEKNYKEEKKKIMDLFKRSSKVVATYLSVLDPRELFIIERRFGLKTGKRMTLQEIAELQNCTRERVRQIEARSIEKMVRFYSELSY